MSSRAGFLKNKVLYSPIANKSTLRPQSKRGRRGVGGALMLTSLVDAFSILVIFLIMNSASDNSDFENDKHITLPKASQAVSTFKTAVVKFSQGRIFINNEEVQVQALGGPLQKLHDEMKSAGNTAAESLVIVADQDLDFIQINPIIVAGSRVGFSEFKFAVQREGDK